MFDLDKLNSYVEKDLVTRQKHPEHELYIYNYAKKCQYERLWDEVTLACRGLILDDKGNVIARPFPKFFNLEEMSRSDITFSKSFRVQDKLDGSLGIMYRVPGTASHNRQGIVGIATRGSFASDQAIRATEIYNEKYYDYQPPEGCTPLFEIIYPANRIVVNYGDQEDLILLTVINNETGRDEPDAFWFGPRVISYDAIDCKPRDVLTSLNLLDDGNTEGIVMIFDWPKTGPKTRVKMKMEEYKRLHKILTGISTKSIWETLRDGRSLSEILERVPDEFYQWVMSTATELSDEFKWTLQRVQDSFELVTFRVSNIDDLNGRVEYCRQNRKDFALVIKDHQYKGFFFSLLDSKDIGPALWDLVRPTYSKAFANEI